MVLGRSLNATRRDLIRERRIEVVLDVGVNIGQYALKLRDDGYDGVIVSFEPLSDAYADLAAAAASDPGWLT